MRTKIKELKTKSTEFIGKEATVSGWVRTAREQKAFTFVEVNDGSTISNLQVILNSDLKDYRTLLEKLTTGTSVTIQGTVQESPGKGQKVELQAKQVTVIGTCDATDYPLQKKRHSFEFLRTIAHLRPRTNTIGAISRVRNCLAYATHRFYQERGFLYLNSPVITASDCEGAGELFQVTTLNLHELPKTKEGKIDYEEDFFARQAYLTCSGQLNAEIFSCALSDVYTFGPTFRAENSNTSRHLAEFWMIEPEIAFADLNDDMDLCEQYLKYVIKAVLEECPEDIHFFDKFISTGLLERLRHITDSDFERASYSYAVRVLEKAPKKFEYPVRWGADLQSEHERYLAEEYFGKPVIITDYPKDIKAFYMRLNDDQKTVAAMDVLFPKIGEIVGGSQREERYDVLERRLKENNLSVKDYWWYLELRKYGTVPHAGFGVGFERLVQFVTGMDNIRDVIPFPRTPGKAEF